MLRKSQLRKPLQHKAAPVDKMAVLLKVVNNAKQTGKLNLSSQQLQELPDALFADFTTRSNDVSFDSDNKWWEVVEMTKIIAADNMLHSVDPRISSFLGLKVLDLHNNQLSELPDEFSSLENLQSLNLNANNFAVFPSSICGLPLLELHFNNNQIKALPDNIDELGTMQVLNISGNQIFSLPRITESSTNLTHLVVFNIAENRLVDVSGFEFNRFSNLVDLSFANNKLNCFPSLTLPSLQILDLKYNQILEFTSHLDCLKLKDLSLGFNKIHSFGPDCFSLCNALEVFDIRDNNLSAVPAQVLQMYNLRRLDISNNSISHLPPALSLLKYIVAIHWSGNPLRSLPTSGGTANLLHFLSMKLDLSPTVDNENDKVTLPYKPNAIGSHIDWINVNLKSIDIEEIKDTCSQPTILNLSQNQIAALPPNFDQICSRLNSIDLSKNKFTNFPILLNCEHLVTLDLSNNQICGLPILQCSLSHLNSLNLCYNRLTSLSSDFFENLPELSVLLLSNNQLTDVNTEALSKLKALKTLDLGKNNIKMIPPELGRLDLTHLHLLGNSFRIPRADILQKGTSSVLQYLRDRIVV